MKKMIRILLVLFATQVGFAKAQTDTVSTAPAPEYTEVPVDGGNIILKRDSASEASIKPLVCTYFNSSVSGGTIAPGGFVVAYGPYSSNCVGVHSFSYTNRQPFNAIFGLQLQKQSGGTWTTVASGVSSLSYYSAPSGTYRLLATNTGSVTATAWTISLSVPL